MPQLQTAFAIGNSVAVTIPKRLGVLPGFRYRNVPSRGKRIVYEPVEEQTTPVKSVVATRGRKKLNKNIDYYRDYVKRNSGAIKLDMTTEEFMKIKKYCHDHFYEEG